MIRLKILLAFCLIFLGGAVLAPLHAQSDVPTTSPDMCAVVLKQLWTTASTNCINRPSGYVCNGGAPPAAEPSGLVGNALAPTGALVDVSQVKAIRTAPITTENTSAGIAWLRLPDPLNLTFLMLGDVTLFDVTTPDLPPWTSSLVTTSPAPSGCPAAPRSAVIVQTTKQSRLAINGISLVINGTLLIATDGTQTLFIALSGESSVLSLGQQQYLPSGEQINVPHNPGDFAKPSDVPSAPIPFDPSYVANLPVPLFDQPIVLPQPGFASTQGSINLRAAPSTNAAVITQVPGGRPLTILGRNPENTWYNVRLQNGQTGWMLASLLAANVGDITAIYTQTPLPPQRYGDLGTQARVKAPAGVNLRSGPDATFPAIAIVSDGTTVDLLARSPYLNGWIKVNVSGTIGWLSLLVLDTQAYIDALPIDYNVPPIPTPTRIPGSFGNAYPNPTEGK